VGSTPTGGTDFLLSKEAFTCAYTSGKRSSETTAPAARRAARQARPYRAPVPLRRRYAPSGPDNRGNRVITAGDRRGARRAPRAVSIGAPPGAHRSTHRPNSRRPSRHSEEIAEATTSSRHAGHPSTWDISGYNSGTRSGANRSGSTGYSYRSITANRRHRMRPFAGRAPGSGTNPGVDRRPHRPPGWIAPRRSGAVAGGTGVAAEVRRPGRPLIPPGPVGRSEPGSASVDTTHPAAAMSNRHSPGRMTPANAHVHRDISQLTGPQRFGQIRTSV
jgi:hypothetical protein